jgi:hypothetical protein
MQRRDIMDVAFEWFRPYLVEHEDPLLRQEKKEACLNLRSAALLRG